VIVARCINMIINGLHAKTGHRAYSWISGKRVTWCHLGCPRDALQRRFSEVRSSWGAKYGLRKAVNRLTLPVKTLKKAHNTGFLGPATGCGDGRGVAFLWRRRGSDGSVSPFVSSGGHLAYPLGPLAVMFEVYDPPPTPALVASL